MFCTLSSSILQSTYVGLELGALRGLGFWCFAFTISGFTWDPVFRIYDFRVYLGIQKPTVLRVRPSNEGVIAYYFVGFGQVVSLIESLPGRSTATWRNSLRNSARVKRLSTSVL